MLRVFFAELRHHIGQVILIAIDLIVSGKNERQTLVDHEIFKSAADDVAQAFLRGRDLKPDNLEFSGDCLRSLSHLGVSYDSQHVLMLGQTGN